MIQNVFTITIIIFFLHIHWRRLDFPTVTSFLNPRNNHFKRQISVLNAVYIYTKKKNVYLKLGKCIDVRCWCFGFRTKTNWASLKCSSWIAWRLTAITRPTWPQENEYSSQILGSQSMRKVGKLSPRSWANEQRTHRNTHGWATKFSLTFSVGKSVGKTGCYCTSYIRVFLIKHSPDTN